MRRKVVVLTTLTPQGHWLGSEGSTGMLVFRQRSNKSTKNLLDNLSNALAFQRKTPGFHPCDTFSFTSVVINSFGSLTLRHQAQTELMVSCGRLRLVKRNIPAQAGRRQK